MSKYQKIGKNDGREDLLFYPNTSILLDYGRIKCEYKKRQTSKTMFVFILKQYIAVLLDSKFKNFYYLHYNHIFQ